MKTKKLLIVGTTLLILGTVMLFAVLIANNFNFIKIGGYELVEKSYTLTGEFSNISLDMEDSNVFIYKSTDNTNKVEALMYEENNITICIENNNLIISEENVKYYDLIKYSSIFTIEPIVKLYLTNELFDEFNLTTSSGDITVSKEFIFNSFNVYGKTSDVTTYCKINTLVDIVVSTGDVELYNIDTKTIDIEVTTGDVKIKDIVASGNISVKTTTGDLEIENTKCESLKLTGTTGEKKLKTLEVLDNVELKTTTGEIKINELIALNILVEATSSGNCMLNKINANSLSIDLGTGDCELEKVNLIGDFNFNATTGDLIFSTFDAKNIYIEATTGSIKGKVLTEKIFICNSTSGSVNVPDTSTGGTCKVKTTTGSIDISIEK